jgi:hypothetical protein
MTDSQMRARPELIEELEKLTRKHGAAPEELETAAHKYAEYERWFASEVQKALEDEAAGAQGRDIDEIFAEMNAIVEKRLSTPGG